jgi:carboxypeptidase PM20D1
VALAVFAAAVALVFVVMLVRTLRLPKPVTVAATGDAVALDDDAMAARLGEAVKIPTISTLPAGDPQNDLAGFQALLRRLFPRVHSDLKLEDVGDYNLLFHWEGTDPTLAPIVLMSHQDVVAIAPGTESDWEVPPFSGAVKDGFIWGRGTLDDKVGVLGLLEAVEWLRAQNFRPQRGVYLAFGRDEEVGGELGAMKTAAFLAAKSVKPLFVNDEGGAIGVGGMVPGIDVPTALIAVAEKGYLTLTLRAQAQPGHSSMPPRRTLVGRLARALANLEENPMPLAVKGPTRSMLEALAPSMSFGQRFAIANLWAFEPVLVRVLGASDSTRATLGTTTALTMYNAGIKDNVLPGRAEAKVNFRLMPGDTVASVVEHVRRTMADDSITIEAFGTPQEPSAVSDAGAPEYAAIARVIRQSFDRVVVAPFLTTGATDAYHLGKLTDRVYRFLPIPFAPSDLARFHGTNERVAVKDYGAAVRFYVRLIKESAGGPPS